MELLARLTAGSPPLEFSSRSTSTTKVNSADVAMALGQVKPPVAQLLVRYAYAGQDEVLPELLELLIQEQPTIWSNWGDNVHKLIAMGVEYLKNPELCSRCSGRGTYWEDDTLRDCIDCGGDGRMPNTEINRAKTFGVARSTWYRLWKERFAEVEIHLADMVLDADKQIRRQLYHDPGEK